MRLITQQPNPIEPLCEKFTQKDSVFFSHQHQQDHIVNLLKI